MVEKCFILVYRMKHADIKTLRLEMRKIEPQRFGNTKIFWGSNPRFPTSFHQLTSYS
jgi:hypothetical protein